MILQQQRRRWRYGGSDALDTAQRRFLSFLEGEIMCFRRRTSLRRGPRRPVDMIPQLAHKRAVNDDSKRYSTTWEWPPPDENRAIN